jgi:hypothetical protein
MDLCMHLIILKILPLQQHKLTFCHSHINHSRSLKGLPGLIVYIVVTEDFKASEYNLIKCHVGGLKIC